MKISRLQGAILACLTSLYGIGTANAAFVLTIDDPSIGTGAEVSITDQDLADQNTNVGAIVFNGSIGVFTVNVTTGISKPLATAPQLMDLNSVSVSSAGAGQLNISLTDTGFTGFGPDPFSLGIEATVIHTAAGQISSFDAEIRATDTGLETFYGGTTPSPDPDAPPEEPEPGVGFDFCYDAGDIQDACVDGPFDSGGSGNGGGGGSGGAFGGGGGLTIVPIPAAVWLFASGLLGIVGIARRKKAA
jgi:hypothetical protein